MMEGENANKSPLDYKENVCPIYCELLLQKNQSVLNEYFHFCSARLVSAAADFEKKQMRLCGSSSSIVEAEKRFLELQNELLIENTKEQTVEGVHWWYEAWDATWQLYNPKIIAEIEYHYRSNQFNFTLLNQIGEKVTIDLNRLEEIYGIRVKRIRRSKVDEQQPNYWSLTPMNKDRFVLEIDSSEYLRIKDNFDKTMHGLYTKFLSIERIQNLLLFRQFRVSHDDFLVRYTQEENGTMRFLYHGCPDSVSQRIIERGFNRSYCGVHGCVYGRGVYFSANASYSDKYAIPNDRKEKRMFFSRVLIGRSMIGNPKIYEPEDGYDTTTDGSHIFVCYYDSHCYPEYLLTYM